MPITFYPTANDPPLIGPGIAMSWVTDLIGPIPVDAFWTMTIQRPADEDHFYLSAARVTGGDRNGIWTPWFDPAPSETIAIPLNEIANGTAVTMTVQLMEGTTVVESATVAGTYDTTAGLPLVIGAMASTGTTGFTSSDRALLDQVAANTVVQLPINAVGGLINAGLGRLFHEIPPSILRRHGSLHLTGNGSVSSGSEPFVSYTLGIEWIYDDPPPGYGYTAGNVREYQRRMVQWEPVFQTPLLETYWANLDDAHEAGQRLVWGALTPINLNYWIAPGVGLTVYFLVFNALP